MNTATQEAKHEITCAWPGCENRMSPNTQRLLEQYLRSKPTRGTLFVLGNHPATDWLFVYGKGCFCEHHWFLDPEDEHWEPGPREQP